MANDKDKKKNQEIDGVDKTRIGAAGTPKPKRGDGVADLIAKQLNKDIKDSDAAKKKNIKYSKPKDGGYDPYHDRANNPMDHHGYYYGVGASGRTSGKPVRRRVRTGSQYELADVTASKGLSQLASERMLSGQSMGKSVQGALGERIGAVGTHIKRAFDPMMLLSKIPGIGKFAATAYGMSNKRKKEDITYATGYHVPEMEHEHHGHAAEPHAKTPSNLSNFKSRSTATKTGGDSLEMISLLKIIAKNTMATIGMARDTNVARQNISKLVNLAGGKAVGKADAHLLKEKELHEKTNVQTAKELHETSNSSDKIHEKTNVQTAKELHETSNSSDKIHEKTATSIDNNSTSLLKIIAKNTMATIGMARDTNVSRQNIMKLVSLKGGKATNKADIHMLKEHELSEKTNVQVSETMPSVAKLPKAGGKNQSPSGILEQIYELLSKRFDKEDKDKEIDHNFDEERDEKKLKEQEKLISAISQGKKIPDKETAQPEKEKKQGMFSKLKEGASGMSGVGKTLLAMAASLWIVSKALKNFADVSWGDVLKGVVAMGALVLVSNRIKKGESWKPLLALGAALWLTSEGLENFSKISFLDVAEGVATMYALVKIADKMGKSKPWKPLLALGAALWLTSEGLKNFSKVSFMDVIEGIGVIATLAATTKLMGKSQPWKPLLALGASLWLVSEALENFGKISFGEIATGIATLTALALTTKLIGKSTPWKPLLALGASLWLVSEALENFGQITWGEITKGLVTLTALALTTKLIDKVASWKPLLALGASLWLVSEALDNFGKISWGDIIKGTAALAGLAVVTKLIDETVGMKGVLVLGAMAASLWVLSKALQNFSEIKWADLGKAAVSLGVLTAAMFGLSMLAPELILGSAALAVMGGALWIFGKAMKAVVEPLDMFTTDIERLGKVDGMNLLKVAAGLGALSAAMIAFGAATAIAGLENLVGNLLSIGQDSPVDQLEKIGKAGPGILAAANGMEKLAKAMKAFGNIKVDDLSKLMDVVNDFPWIKATLFAAAGGVFTATTSNATMTGGDASKMQQQQTTASPASPTPSNIGARAASASNENRDLTGPASNASGGNTIINAPKTTNINGGGGKSSGGQTYTPVRNDDSVLARVQYQNVRPV